MMTMLLLITMDNTEEHCYEDKDEEQESKLMEFHVKNYFNSTMGGKDL